MTPIKNPIKKKYKLDKTKIIKKEDASKLNNKQSLCLQREYCLNECEENCDILVMLKKIYWELRKQNGS